jgi:sugar phosphate isomerase/epimerase
MNMTRRTFGQIAVSGLASTATLLAAKKIPIAVQLYSVRHIAQKDLAGVLEQVAKLGFKGVEFAGYYGHEAGAVRKMLDANGLKVAGTHTALNLLQGDELPKTIDYMKTIGNKNVIVPSMPGQYRKSVDGWKEAARVFNEINEKVKGHGLVLGYHNHTVEFEKPEGTTETPFDAFFGTAMPAVKVQLDIGHTRRAGADPLEVIRKYKGRVISVHIKEYNPNNPDAPLGDGLVQWKEIFAELEKQGKTEWYIVEEEGKSCKEYECIGGAIERLHKMGK